MKASLTIAVLALVVAVFALVRTFDTTASYSEEQRAAALAAACSAYETVRTAVAANTNTEPPGGSGDISGALAAAANARVALLDGGQYLLARLDPATPSDVADDMRRFANQLMDIGAAATAGVPNTDADQAKRLADAEAASAAISSRCR
ncbi:hypothetical protein ACAG25_06520 [Mycobacterium sp. pV006]|uniref:hypothetical protein n=1 Tax=Mycobacterium sp. pV006 TaxID=3238983 RepID=UPI00351BD1B7